MPLSTETIESQLNIFTNKNHNVMIKKRLYEAPEAELIFVKIEENILSGFSDQGTETYDYDPEEDL